MEKKIRIILARARYGVEPLEDLEQELLNLHILRLLLFQKNRLDLLNWAKSELKQETNTKLGKRMTPYRTDKIIFLRRMVRVEKIITHNVLAMLS